MTLGQQGVPGEDEEHFNGPSDIAFAPNGDFYVCDGYGNSRVVKFSKEGKYLLAWGKKGSAEGEFNLPHAVAVDRTGRVYVADRENLRIQVFDANGRFLAQWKHEGQPNGLAFGPDGNLYIYYYIGNTEGATEERILKVSIEDQVLALLSQAL